MLEQTGDIWEARKPNDWICITTCGVLRKDGNLVMGRGIALEASRKYPGIAKLLGTFIKEHGLRLEILFPTKHKLIIFPTKYDYRDKSDINLILKSTIQLVDMAAGISGRILLPRPGCGNGRLDWLEVEPLLRHYLTDDRFIVFHNPLKVDFNK